MSKMIRVSDDVYEELSKKGTVKDSFDDVLRKSLNIPGKRESVVDYYRHKFEMHYPSNEVDEIFNTILTLHMGIRYESELNDYQKRSLNALVQYNIVTRSRAKGGYHLWINEDGKKLASQLVAQHIDNNIDTLKKLLAKYSNKITGCALYTLLAGSSSYLPSRYSMDKHVLNSQDEPIVNEKIIDNLNTFIKDLVDAKFAVKSFSRYSSGELNMLGVEIVTCEEVMFKISEIADKPIKSIGRAIVTYRVLRTIERVYRENIAGMPNTKTRLYDISGQCNSTVDGIRRYLELASKYGYASKINDDSPVILVFDMNTMIKETFTQIGKFILDESYDTDLILDDLYGMDYMANIEQFRRP